MNRAWFRITAVSAAVATAAIVLTVAPTSAEPREGPAPVAAARADWTLSPMRVITAPGMHLFEHRFETTFDDMGQIIMAEVDELLQTVSENDVPAAGQVVFRYIGVGPDRAKPFTLCLGVPVPADTKPAGKYQVVPLEPFRAASALYNGSVDTIPMAYGKLVPEMIAAGHVPSEEAREVYLYWEGRESANNVVWIQMGMR